MTSIAEISLVVSGLFEAEVLTELLLWRWGHPFKNDEEFRENLLEEAVTSLRRAVSGQKLLESLPAEETNLIAAIYYAEWNSLENKSEDPNSARKKWLENLRQAFPSCFCGQENLPSMEIG